MRRTEVAAPMSVEEPVEVVNQAIGAKIRFYRTLFGMSQKRLAEAIGVTFQLVQKYENGSIRISVSRLYQIAEALGVTVPALLGEEEGVQGNAPAVRAPSHLMEAGQALQSMEAEGMPAQKDSFELLRAFYTIEDANVRRRIVDLVDGIAASKS